MATHRDSLLEAHCGDDPLDSANHSFLKAAGRSSVPPTDDWLDEPNTAIGGVSVLQDVASAGNAARACTVPLAFPSKEFDAAQAVLRRGACFQDKDEEAVALVDAAVGRSAEANGGWVPADAANARGYRVGSARWKDAVSATSQQIAARAAVKEERRRSERFFAKAEEEHDTEAAREAHHWQEHVVQAARAVDQKKSRNANPGYVDVGQGIHPFAPNTQRVAQPHSDIAVAKSLRHGNGSTGFRPGSAAARKAAGGLYENPPDNPYSTEENNGHSRRLIEGEDNRLARQEVSAMRNVEIRTKARDYDEVAEKEEYAKREAQAKIAMRSRDFGAYAKGQAERKTINLQMNAAMAPQGRVHPRYRPADFRPPGPPGGPGGPYTISGGFARGHMYAVV